MRTSLHSVVLLLAIAVAAPVGAQGATLQNPDTAAMRDSSLTRDNAVTSSRLGAPVTGLQAAAHTKTSETRTLPPAVSSSNANLGQARAMMIVGAAAFVAGALIDNRPIGTIFMVGGAVIGLVGLYQYLQ